MATSRRRKKSVKTVIPTPILMGSKRDDTAIVWTWESSPEYCYALVDEHDNIITRLPYGKDRYTETGLTPGQTYLRKLAAYNNETSSEYSSLVSVTTKSKYEALNTTPFKPLVHSVGSLKPQDVVIDNLKAFQSGVGHGLDLKVEKQSLEEYRESFSLTTKVEGIYTQKTKSYTQIPFSYRVKATAKYTEDSTEGFVKFKTTAYDKAFVSFDVIRYATASINIRARVRFEVEYYMKEFGALRTERKTMYTKELSHDLVQKDKVHYDDIAGNVYLKSSDIKLSDQTIGELIQEAINGDPVVSAYHAVIPCKVYGLLIEDDYPYTSEGDNYWKFGKERVFSPAGSGTINATAKTTDEAAMLKSHLYLVGYARAGLYTGFKHYEKEIDSSERYTVIALSNAELKNIPIKNVDDTSFSFQFSLAEITSDIQRINVKADRPDRVKVTRQIPETVSNDPVVIVQFSEAIVSDVLTYRYSNESFNTILPYYKHVIGMTPNVENEYLFLTEILDCSHNITLNGQPVKKGTRYKQVGTPMSTIEIITTPIQKTRDWEMILPDLSSDSPLTGVVNNGPRDVDGGKRNYSAYVPKFPLPNHIVPGSLLYQVLFESLNDEESMVSSCFENGEFFGQRMGGMITFSSEAFTYEDVQFKNTITEDLFHPLEIEGLSEVTFALELKKSMETRPESMRPYKYYTLSVTSNNNDVVPVSYPEIIEFNDEGVVNVEVGCRIQQNAVSKWSPRIHSGHYYINQHEYFMPAEFVTDAKFTENNTFSEETFDVNLRALVKRSMPITRVTEKWQLPNEYYSSAERHPSFKYYLTQGNLALNQWIEATPVIDTTYYKKYQDVSFISPVKTLNHVIDVFGQLKWDEEKSDGTNIKPYIRAYDLEHNLWSGWIEVKAGYAIEGLPNSNLVQLRFDCHFNQTETTETFTDIYSCAYDFEQLISKEDSTNVETAFDVIRGDNPTKEAIYVTTVMDRGVTVASNFRGRSSHEGLVNYYIATSNDKEVLLTNPQWRHCGGDSFVNEERYVRYKITIPAYEEVYSFKIETKTRTLSEAFARFGNFKLNGRKEGAFRYEECTERFSYTRLNDGKVTSLESSIKPLLESMVTPIGYQFEDIYEFHITSGSSNFELQYDLENTETSLYAKSLTSIINDLHLPLIKFEHNQATIKGIPQQFSPVVVEHPVLGPLREAQTLGENNTFVCRYDWLKQTTTIEVQTVEPIDEAFVSFETGVTSNYKPLTHLSLNPIYNTENEGFIYISYEKPVPTQLQVQANPTTFLPYQEDHTAVYVRLADAYDNPVPGKLIQVGQTIGKIECDNYMTDQNGIVVLRYNSPKGTGTEKLEFSLADQPSIKGSIVMTIAEPSR